MFKYNITLPHFMVITIITLLILIQPISSSMGDYDPTFRNCVRRCIDNRTYYELNSFMRKVFMWDERSECEYNCMRMISDLRVENNKPVYKYFGHWPYYRVMGFQEPASAIFSLLNAIPHMYNIQSWLLSKTHPNQYMRNWILVYAFSAVLAWICSFLFHSRKLYITTQLDYIFALIFVYVGFSVTLRYTCRYILDRYKICSIVLYTAMTGVCIYRIYQMIRGNITYDEHMTVSIVISISQTILWILWIIYQFKNPNITTQKKKSRNLCLLCQLWFTAASSMEIFDFSPIFYHFDAHSLWHFSTVPLGFLWYRFWQIELSAEKVSSEENREVSSGSSSSSYQSTTKKLS